MSSLSYEYDCLKASNLKILKNTPFFKTQTRRRFFAKETFRLTQKTMAELFGITIPSISRHLKNIYESQELSPDSTVSKIETVQMEGERQATREIEIYNKEQLCSDFQRMIPSKHVDALVEVLTTKK